MSVPAPRWMHAVYAFFAGYFWIPCPECGRSFGGHENGPTLYVGMGRGATLCPRHEVKYEPGDHYLKVFVDGKLRWMIPDRMV